MVFNGHPQTMGEGLAMIDMIRRNPEGSSPYVFQWERVARYMAAST